MWKISIAYPCDNLRVGDEVVAMVPGYPDKSGNITNFVMWSNASPCPHIPRPHVSINPTRVIDTYHPGYIYQRIGNDLVHVCSVCIYRDTQR